MTIIKANSYKGKQLIAKGQNWEGKYLNQVYDSWSDAKQEAWTRCFEMCCEEGGEEFSIVSHNTFEYINHLMLGLRSWFTDAGMRYITPQNSYLVVW